MIKFNLTFKDIEAFNKYHMKRNATFSQKYLHWIILFFFVVLMVAKMHNDKASAISYLIIIPLVIAIVLIQRTFSNFLRRKSLIAYLKNNPRIIGNREMSFDEKKLNVIIDQKNSEYPFNSFFNLEETKEHYFAYVTKDSAVIIPKRLMAQSQDISVIIEKIKEGIKK